MKRNIICISMILFSLLCFGGCTSNASETQAGMSAFDTTSAAGISSAAEETTRAAETAETDPSDESAEWFTPVFSERDVTGQGFLGAKGEPYIMDGEQVTIPVYFHTLNDGETARVTVEFGAFQRLVRGEGASITDSHWLEPEEKLEDGDVLRWYQSDEYATLSSGTAWGHALIEEEDRITGYAVFLFDVPERGWSGSEIVREARFDETAAVTETQVLEEIDRVIEAYIANHEVTGYGGAVGDSATKGEAVRFEMTETVYDVNTLSMEELAEGQYVLSGAKYYPDIVLTDDQKQRLEQVGLLLGFLDGEEMFRITKKGGLYWFAWGDEKEYEIQFVEASFSAWEEGWVMGMRHASNPIGWHYYGPLDEEFELTVLADQVIAVNGVRAQSWGITGETLTAKEIYEIYAGYGNKWSQDGEESVRLRIYEEAEGLRMEIVYRP